MSFRSHTELVMIRIAGVMAGEGRHATPVSFLPRLIFFRLGKIMWLEALQSKRVWVAVAALITAVGKDYLTISEDQVQLIVLTLASWILGDSLRATDPRKEIRRR